MLLQVGLDLGHEGCLGFVANDGVGNLATLEEDESGDGHDVELLCESAFVVDVALEDGQTIGHFLANLLDDGTKGAARSAPAGPEVNQDGLGRVQDIGLKRCGGEFCCHNLVPFCVFKHKHSVNLYTLYPFFRATNVVWRGDGAQVVGIGTTYGRIYVRKLRAELKELEELGVQTAGNATSTVLFVKGELSPAEQAGAELLSGADGKALRAALIKLGYAPEDWAAIRANVDPALFRRAVAVLDPSTLVMCDEAAATLVRDAFADDLVGLLDLQSALLSPGWVVRVVGMRMLNLGGFEQALADAKKKQLMWAYLKQIPPLGEPY